MTSPTQIGNFPRLILASGSIYKKSLLDQLRIPFEAKSPDLDEEKYKIQFLAQKGKISDLAPFLAEQKALACLRDLSQSKEQAQVVIGTDQLIHIEGQILNKPGNLETAHAQLSLMQGKTHELITAVTLLLEVPHKKLHSEHFTVKAQLTMRSLTSMEIHRYLNQDSPLDCAGSYKLESLGIALFESVACEDFSCIVGLPLMKLSKALRSMGFLIP